MEDREPDVPVRDPPDDTEPVNRESRETDNAPETAIPDPEELHPATESDPETTLSDRMDAVESKTDLAITDSSAPTRHSRTALSAPRIALSEILAKVPNCTSDLTEKELPSETWLLIEGIEA